MPGPSSAVVKAPPGYSQLLRYTESGKTVVHEAVLSGDMVSRVEN